MYCVPRVALQDEDGHILHGGLPLSAPRPSAVPMEELEVREPVGFSLDDVGYVETGDGYAFGGRDCDPLVLGEMVSPWAAVDVRGLSFTKERASRKQPCYLVCCLSAR